jgi:hypothetical protein
MQVISSMGRCCASRPRRPRLPGEMADGESVATDVVRSPSLTPAGKPGWALAYGVRHDNFLLAENRV